jgi:hypothetical protein
MSLARINANEPLVPRREQVTHHRHAMSWHFMPMHLLEVFILARKVLQTIELRERPSSQLLLVALRG